MNVIISGINGFLGKHAEKAFKAREDKVIGIPRELLYADPGKLMEWVALKKPDIILHLAGYGNHGMQKEEDKIIMANYFATWNLLKATSFIDYKAFINVATSSCYGHKTEPMKETDFLEPDTFYAASKAAAIHLARAYCRQYNKPVATVMPFSIYGEGEADWRFIPTAIRNMVKGTTMQFNPKPQHDWIHVEDFITGVLTVVDNIGRVKGETVNIGTGYTWSNRSVLSLLEEVAGTECKTEEGYVEPPHHSARWIADNEKLISLGWGRRVNFKRGLQRCWDYYKMKYA